MKKFGIAVPMVVILSLVAMAAGCGGNSSSTPSVPATDSEGVPNYANASNWLALPSADSVGKEVDVFFLYPTIYQQSSSSDPMVCAVDNPQMLAGAAAAFSRTATVFAPMANI